MVKLNKIEKNEELIGHTLQSGPGLGPGPSEKADPGPIEKGSLHQNVLKESLSTNLRVLISNMTIIF